MGNRINVFSILKYGQSIEGKMREIWHFGKITSGSQIMISLIVNMNILLTLNFLLDLVVLNTGHGISGVAIVSISFYLGWGLLSVFWLRRSLK